MAFIGNALRYFISVVIIFATLVAPGVSEEYTASYASLDSENCLLNFVAVSDIHVQTDEGNKLSSAF